VKSYEKNRKSMSGQSAQGITGRTGIAQTKVVHIADAPQIIDQTNEKWARFGWNVQSVQSSVSPSERYAVITYQRDRNMHGYDRLCELEKEYEQVCAEIRAIYAEGAAGVWQSMRPFERHLTVLALLMLLPAGLIWLLIRRIMLHQVRLDIGQGERGIRLEELTGRREEIEREAESIALHGAGR